ncbi:MAG TPA: GTPase ObgE [Candidatus Saccharimonadales bacterium]|nr:GTPase ObgE [Candidatus Saccharimonadales bacterium]
MFADKIEINVKAGKGGDGLLSFRQEKYRAKGGPDGGDGGRGGSVIFVANHNTNTLADYRTKRLVKADGGKPGGTDRKHGKNGDDITVKVPVGTLVHDSTGSVIADLVEDGQQAVVARGGRGGFGNAHFVSSTRQTPRAAELGEKGEERQLTLELKLVADVGLVGLPNAGKSTLLSVISNAKPEIGDYPFTTLVPNLGVVDFEDYTFLMADIPGLIEGASEGKGLGDEFLRHVERTAVLIHLIDAGSEDIIRDYETIQTELKNYAVDLSQKPQLVVINKIDSVSEDDLKSAMSNLSKHLSKGSKVFAISGVAKKGLDELLRAALPLIKQARAAAAEEVAEKSAVVIDEASQPELWQVEKMDDKFVVKGEKIEGFARRTDWDNDESVARLVDIMRKRGVSKELTRQGAESGSVVEIAGHQFEWLG